MNQALPEIDPSWSLGELKRECPGVEMALFACFGIGSRERSGFSADEKLEELLRRHLVFDVQRACRRLNDLAAEDREHSIKAEQLASERGLVVVDARSTADYERAHLPGALLLSHENVQSLHQQETPRIVTVCRDGSQAPAASRVLRSQGLNARHLVGGLESWTNEVDEDFPVLYPLNESGGHWYLLADDQTLRYRRGSQLPDRTARLISRPEMEAAGAMEGLLEALPDLSLVVSTSGTFAVRGVPGRLADTISLLPQEVRDSPLWEQLGSTGDEEDDVRRLDRVLAEEAPEILGNHKGTVEVKDYVDRVLTLELGGGCAGCASAQITTQRELAARLYREVPLLDRIKG
jgi:rhodanese-related sulfurtransferase/Fe-S cluster biogenesis protein NfuA